MPGGWGQHNPTTITRWKCLENSWGQHSPTTIARQQWLLCWGDRWRDMFVFVLHQVFRLLMNCSCFHALYIVGGGVWISLYFHFRTRLKKILSSLSFILLLLEVVVDLSKVSIFSSSLNFLCRLVVVRRFLVANVRLPARGRPSIRWTVHQEHQKSQRQLGQWWFQVELKVDLGYTGQGFPRGSWWRTF